MPGQRDSAENKPGETAMIRKLSVTVLALSFAALGCGSDNGTPPKEAGPPDVAPRDIGVGPDLTPPPPDLKPTPDVPQQPDVAAPDLPMGPDVPKGEAGLGVDGPGVDVETVVDTGGLQGEAQEPDLAPAIDGGIIDSGTNG